MNKRLLHPIGLLGIPVLALLFSLLPGCSGGETPELQAIRGELKKLNDERALTDAEVDACFALEYHLKHVDTIFRRVFGA